MFDSDRSGTINLQEFSGLWAYLQQWKKCFDTYDKDGSGKIDFSELKTALQQFGYTSLSDAFFARVLHCYDYDKGGTIGLDEFIQLCCELNTLTKEYRQYDPVNSGTITVGYEQFLSMCFTVR